MAIYRIYIPGLSGEELEERQGRREPIDLEHCQNRLVDLLNHQQGYIT